MAKAATLFADPFWLAQDAYGTPIVGAELTVFLTGTTTPVAVYTDEDPEHHPPADLESAHGERRAP